MNTKGGKEGGKQAAINCVYRIKNSSFLSMLRSAVFIPRDMLI